MVTDLKLALLCVQVTLVCSASLRTNHHSDSGEAGDSYTDQNGTWKQPTSIEDGTQTTKIKDISPGGQLPEEGNTMYQYDNKTSKHEYTMCLSCIDDLLPTRHQ